MNWRSPATYLQIRPVRIGLIVLAVLLVLYTAFGFWMVPRLVRSNLLGFVSENYQRTASLGEVTFNPFNLKLELRDFSMPDADNAPLLSFERLLLNFDISSVWKVGASFAAVELDQPFARVLLRTDGTLNLADLAKLKESEPKDPQAEEETPRVFIDRLSVATGRVAFEDRARATPFATELRPINFELRDFSTGGESGNAYSLRGASSSGEGFAWSGNFALKPLTSSGKFEVTSLKAHTVWSYLQEALPFEFTKGVIDLNGEYSYTASDSGGLRFDVHQVSLVDFGMRPPGKDYDYLEVAALKLEETQVQVRTRRVDIARVKLDGGALRARRDAEGNINLAELAGPAKATPAMAEAAPAPAAGQTPATPPAPDASPAAGTAPAWVVAAPDIAVSGVNVEFEDSLVKPTAKFVLNPVNVTVNGYSTAPATRFKVDATAVGASTGKLKLQADTDAGMDAWQARVEASELDLMSLQPYLSTYTQITLKSGRLDSAMDLAGSTNGPFEAKGQVIVHKLSAIDNALEQDLLKWDQLSLSGIEYSSAPARLAIARIDARAPYARLIIAQDQSLNITKLFSPAEGAQPAAVQTVRTPAGETRAPGGNPADLRINIGTIKIISGSANFADFWIKPSYAVSLQELAGSVSGLSSDPKSRAKVDLKGRVDRYAPAEIAGQLNVLSAALYTDIHVKFDGVEMTSVTPYSGHFAGYAIEKGKLSIDVSYLVENRQLTAKQKFVVDQLQLGDRVESPDAVKLPLKLAVALLKDRNGVIDIDLPMTGSLDDPQFRMGPLIWKAFVGLLTKVATAPFALLARLGGGNDEEINLIEFEPGATALDAVAQERMKSLSKALSERPTLELEVPTTYSPEADGRALANARLERQLATYAKAPPVDEAARFDLLRQAHDKEIGGKTPLPPAAVQVLEQRKQKSPAISYTAAIEELSAPLLLKYAASEGELTTLARARADAIRESLLASGEVDAKRVFVLGVKPVAEAGGKVRVELALK